MESFSQIFFDSSFYDENIDLFIKRYPSYTFFLPSKKSSFTKEKRYLSSTFLKKEKLWFESFKNIENLDNFFVYGLNCGLSFPFFKSWLEKDRTRNLIYLEDDEESFSSFLASSHAKELLLNPSVHIFFKFPFEESSKFLERCASNFFSGKIEVVKSPSLNFLKKSEFDLIRSKLLRFSTYYMASYIDDLYSYLNFSNFYKNLEKLSSSFQLDLLKDKFKGLPAIVCGAGPSLYLERQNLKKIKNKALIIAGGSAIPALLSYGIKPHLGVVIDPNEEEAHRMKNAKEIDFPIAYSTRVHSSIFKYFKGALGYIGSIGEGLERVFLENSLNLKKDFVLGQNLSKEALSVSMMNLEIAHFLGCSPIILSGVDLSYKNNKRYSPGVLKKYNRVLINKDDPGDFLVKSKNRLTNIKWIMEKDAISSYKKNLNIDLINTSRSGLKIDGVKHQSLKDVSKHFEKKEDIDDLMKKELSIAQYKISSDEISKLKEDLRQSLINSKNLISQIKDEVKSLKESNSDKCSSPLMILYQRELEEQIAYKYFLSRPKKALAKSLSNFYKSFSDNLSKEENLNKLLDFWDNFEQIALRYIEGTSSLQ